MYIFDPMAFYKCEIFNSVDFSALAHVGQGLNGMDLPTLTTLTKSLTNLLPFLCEILTAQPLKFSSYLTYEGVATSRGGRSSPPWWFGGPLFSPLFLFYFFFIIMCVCVCLTSPLYESYFDFPSSKFILIAVVSESCRNGVELTVNFVILAIAYTLAASEFCPHDE